MKQRGRPVLGAVSGFFLGLFVGLDLLFFGVIPLDSVMITALPIVGLIAGIVLGVAAPLGRSKAAPAAAPPAWGEAPSAPPPYSPPPAPEPPPAEPPPTA